MTRKFGCDAQRRKASPPPYPEMPTMPIVKVFFAFSFFFLFFSDPASVESGGAHDGFEHLNHFLANLRNGDSMTSQHFRGQTGLFVQQSKEQMLCADVGMPQKRGLDHRPFNHTIELRLALGLASR